MKFKIFILTIAISLFFPHPAFSFGISPVFYSNNNLLPGSSYSEHIIFTRNSGDIGSGVDYRIVIPKTNNWIIVNENQPIIFPENQNQIKVKIDINIPKDAQYGKYTGIITFFQKNNVSKNQGGNQTVLGATLNLSFTIGSKIESELIIKNISPLLADSKLKFSFLKFNGLVDLPIQIKNNGNTEGAIEKITINIYNENESHLLDTVNTDGPFEQIKPFSTTESVITLPHNLSPGGYVAYLNIFSNNKLTINGTKRMTLNILPAKTFHSTTTYLKIFTQKNKLFFVNIFIVTIVFILLFWLYLRRKRKHH